MKKMMMKVSNITAESTYELRHKVLWPHLANQSDCTIAIDFRDDARHFGTIMNNQVIGIGSFFATAHDSFSSAKKPYRLRAMATDPNFRGRNAGGQLIKFAVNDLRDQGVDLIWCDARKVAIGFYEKLGFDRIDEWYEKPNVGPHQLMFLDFRK